MSKSPDVGWTGRTRPVEFSELDVLEAVGNPGAMGTVYRVAGQPSCLYKKYINPSIHDARLDRLIEWRNNLSEEAREFLDSRCAWPLVAVTEKGRTAGFLMRSAPDDFWVDMAGERHTLELQHLIHTAGAKAFGIQLPGPEQRLALVEKMADTLAFFEAHGIVYGDVNERNVLWTLETSPRVFIIDCDNAYLQGTSIGVAMPRNASWRDPDLPEGGHPDLNSDRYTLAVFCYRVFYEGYLQPGVAKASLDDNRDRVLLPEGAPHFPDLERNLSYGLGRPQTRPSGAQWVSTIRSIDLSVPQPPPSFAPNSQGEQLLSSGARRPRRTLRTALATVAVVMLLLAIVTITLLLELHVIGVSSALSQYMGSWPAGQVKIAVPQSFFSEEQASRDDSKKWEPNDADWDSVPLRVSIQNCTAQTLDLPSASTHLVLVFDEHFLLGSTTTVPAKQVAGVATQMHIYATGFLDDT